MSNISLTYLVCVKTGKYIAEIDESIFVLELSLKSQWTTRVDLVIPNNYAFEINRIL